MSEINLTYCPEGGEHEWSLWSGTFTATLNIDCNRCHQVAFSGDFSGDFSVGGLVLNPLPVQLNQEFDGFISASPRREV